MAKEVLIIKNMVCPRCVEAVTRIFRSHGKDEAAITLGRVELREPLSGQDRELIAADLEAAGFELLDDPRARTVSEIKRLVIERVRNLEGPADQNFSTYLSEALNKDFGSLSRLYSSVEGVTLERYILTVKTELVKELLVYGELTLSEIAFRLDYSSAAHLSAQFKKETGMTPTAFRKMGEPVRKPLDSL